MPEMTEQQAAVWPEYVAEARLHGPSLSRSEHQWDFTWREETRPGRGHDLSAMQWDGEYVAHIGLDVYGRGFLAVAETHLIHNSADDECACEPCSKEREDEDNEHE